MIQGMVVKLIFNAIMKKINEKHNLKKIDKYVNEDNELDIQLRQAQKTMALFQCNILKKLTFYFLQNKNHLAKYLRYTLLCI